MRRSEATNLHPGSIEHVALDARGGATIAAITPPEIRLRKSASLAALGSSRGGNGREKGGNGVDEGKKTMHARRGRGRGREEEREDARRKARGNGGEGGREGRRERRKEREG